MSQLQQQLEAFENELEDTIELDQSALEASLEALQEFVSPGDSDNELASTEASSPRKDCKSCPRQWINWRRRRGK